VCARRALSRPYAAAAAALVLEGRCLSPPFADAVRHGVPARIAPQGGDASRPAAASWCVTPRTRAQAAQPSGYEPSGRRVVVRLGMTGTGNRARP
jgi:hypothetical protein